MSDRPEPLGGVYVPTPYTPLSDVEYHAILAAQQLDTKQDLTMTPYEEEPMIKVTPHDYEDDSQFHPSCMVGPVAFLIYAAATGIYAWWYTATNDMSKLTPEQWGQLFVAWVIGAAVFTAVAGWLVRTFQIGKTGEGDE